jgi:hypothetical protein
MQFRAKAQTYTMHCVGVLIRRQLYHWGLEGVLEITADSEN